MDDEREISLEELAAELSEDAKELGKTTGKVALSAVLATSLAGVLQQPPNTDLMSLPEATPIVRVLEDEKPEVSPPEEEIEVDDAKEHRQRLLKMLKYLLVALFLLAALLFGAMKGCTSCTAGALLPDDDSKQEQKSDEQQDDADGASAAAPFIGLYAWG